MAINMTACASRQSAQSWQLGIVADGCGRTHLVVLMPDAGVGTRRRVNLLAPVGDAQVDDVRAAIVHTFGRRAAGDAPWPRRAARCRRAAAPRARPGHHAGHQPGLPHTERTVTSERIPDAVWPQPWEQRS